MSLNAGISVLRIPEKLLRSWCYGFDEVFFTLLKYPPFSCCTDGHSKTDLTPHSPRFNVPNVNYAEEALLSTQDCSQHAYGSFLIRLHIFTLGSYSV